MSQKAGPQKKRKLDEQPQGRSAKNLKASDGKPVPTSKSTPKTKETPPPPPSNPNKVTLEVFVLRCMGPTGIALMHGRDVISKGTIEVTKAETNDSLRHKIGIVVKQCLPNYQREFVIYMIFCDLLCGTAVSDVLPNNEVYSDTLYARLTTFHDVSSHAPSMGFEEKEHGSPRNPAGADNIKPSVSLIRTSPGNTPPPVVRNWKDESSGKDPFNTLLEIADTHLKGFVDAHELQRIATHIAETAYFNWLDSIPECHVGHMVIQGNPGTGKTTGACAIAGFLAEAGIIRSNCVIKAQRDDLVGRFVGDTEYRTNKVIQDAQGGVIIFDEIYALNKPTSQNDFGKEAFNTIMKYMTSDEAPVFMFLGYKKDMELFVKMNAGFQRRVKHVISLPDYDSRALANIVRFKLKQQNLNYEITYGFEEQFSNLPQERVHYYNASLAQDVVDQALAFARDRVLKLPHNMRKGCAKNIVSSDFDEAFIQIGIELRSKDNHQDYFG